MFSDSERISFCHFREKNSEMTTRFRVQGVLKGIGGPLKNTTPLCIAMVFENSPGDIFEKWVRFGAAFEQACKTSTHWQGLFLSGRNLLFPPEALHYLQCHFSPLAGGSFVRASSNAALNYP